VRAQRRVDGVDVGDDVVELGVCLSRREVELGDEAVELIEHEAGAEALDECLAQHNVGLDLHAFDDVNEDERRVGEVRNGGDLRAEVDVARGVDEADAVPGPAVECDGSGLHGDRPTLLLVEVVHEMEPPLQLWVEQPIAAGGHQVVCQRGLVVVHVHEDPRVKNLTGVLHQ
jgi:hypothetical protein